MENYVNITDEHYDNITKVSEFINLPKNKPIKINGQTSILASGNNSTTIDLVLMRDYYGRFDKYSFEEALNHLEIDRVYVRLQKIEDINKYLITNENKINGVELCSTDILLYYVIGEHSNFELSIKIIQDDEITTCFVTRAISYMKKYKKADSYYTEDKDSIKFTVEKAVETCIDYNDYKKLYHSNMDDDDRNKLNKMMRELAKALDTKIVLYRNNCSKKIFE